MATIWKPQDLSTYKDWVDAILTEASDILSDWEATFVSDIKMRLDRGFTLTEGQAKTLESIYTDKTS